MSQLSFFSAESVPPAVADLTGILAASGQVVLVGYGRVGRRIAAMLGAGDVPFVVAEQNRELVEKLRGQGVAAVWGEMVPLSANERLQAKAISAQTNYRFRVYVRTDVTAKMRAQWTPTWPPGSSTQTLEIHGVIPWDDGRTFMILECGVL